MLCRTCPAVLGLTRLGFEPGRLSVRTIGYCRCVSCHPSKAAVESCLLSSAPPPPPPPQPPTAAHTPLRHSAPAPDPSRMRSATPLAADFHRISSILTRI